jgi:hypothetical protein
MTVCKNCGHEIEGIAYAYSGSFFCGKNCLIKALKEDKIIILKIFNNPQPEAEKQKEGGR